MPKPDWQVIGGEYKAQSGSAHWMMSRYTGQTWSTVGVQASCRRTGETGNSAAVLLRATPDFQDGVGSAYIFQISLDGYYGVWKQVNGSWSWLREWTTSPFVSFGTNVLAATAQGNTLSFFVNGNLVWTGSDVSLTDGLIGLGGYSDGSTHFFDNVVASEVLPSGVLSAQQAELNRKAVPGGERGVAPASELTGHPRQVRAHQDLVV